MGTDIHASVRHGVRLARETSHLLHACRLLVFPLFPRNSTNTLDARIELIFQTRALKLDRYLTERLALGMCDFDGEMRDLGPVSEPLLQALEGKLAEDPALWLRLDRGKPNRFDAFRGSTLHIVFQYPESLMTHTKSRYDSLWPEWAPYVQPLIDDVGARYGYRDGRTARVMLAMLLAGREIAPHVDAAPAAELPHKVHVPLVTDPRVRFYIGGTEHHLARGCAWEVNNRMRHSVRNDAGIDRVHLIFDYWEAAIPAS